MLTTFDQLVDIAIELNFLVPAVFRDKPTSYCHYPQTHLIVKPH